MHSLFCQATQNTPKTLDFRKLNLLCTYLVQHLDAIKQSTDTANSETKASLIKKYENILNLLTILCRHQRAGNVVTHRLPNNKDTFPFYAQPTWFENPNIYQYTFFRLSGELALTQQIIANILNIMDAIEPSQLSQKMGVHSFFETLDEKIRSNELTDLNRLNTHYTFYFRVLLSLFALLLTTFVLIYVFNLAAAIGLAPMVFIGTLSVLGIAISSVFATILYDKQKSLCNALSAFSTPTNTITTENITSIFEEPTVKTRYTEATNWNKSQQITA